MLKSVRSVALAVLCCVAGIVAFSAAVSQGASSPGGGGIGAPVIDGPLSGGLVIPGVDALDGGREVEAQTVARHADPQARFAREVSRTAYEHLGSAAVKHLLANVLSAVVDTPDGSAPPLPAGQHIERYIGTHAADVTMANGKQGVMESFGPIAAPTGHGHFARLDLALSAAGESFAPTRSLLRARLPRRLTDGATLSDGISLVPSDSRGRSSDNPQGAIDGAGVLYVNSNTDTDTFLKPTPQGVEFDAVLRSVASPTNLYYRVGAPEGARLKQGVGGHVVQVVKGRTTLATIVAPYATDAAGEPVPISLKASGRVLQLEVHTNSIQPRYPILVDPYVEDTYLSKPRVRWKFCDWIDKACEGQSSSAFTSSGWGGSSGLTLEGSHYISGEWVSLNYQTQGESKIYDVSGSASGESVGGHVESVAQLVDGKETTNESLWVVEDTNLLAWNPMTSYTKAAISVCPNGKTNCNIGAGAKKNLFRFEQSTSGEGGPMWDTLETANVLISQTEKSPAVSFNTTSSKVQIKEGETIVERENVLYPGNKGWIGPDSSTAFEAIAKDAGIGVSFYSLTSEPTHKFFEENRCEGVQCFPEVKEPYTYSEKLNDGEDTLELYAKNATIGSGASATAKIKVDGTAPTTINLVGLPASKEISEQPYTISAEATDGSGSVVSSGIKSIAVGIDGNEITPKSSTSCEPGPCLAKGEWVINAEGLGAGEHELTVVATDNAGNVATKSYELIARHATPTTVGPGSLDPITGQFSLSATDVSVGGGMGTLGVSRSYSSRQITAGADGPLGGQWILSTGPVQKIEKMPSGGGLVMIGADGGLTSFASNGSGGFTSPPGDKNLTMTEVKEGTETKEFILSDATAGTKTHFTLPAGATTGPWMPHIAEGVLATGTETYKFKTVEVAGKKITEPEEMLAPVPAEVSCVPMKQGCRALTFNYATSTTATGEAPGGWGDYNGHLTRIYLTAWDPKTGKMSTTEIAQYTYDSQGRLRAEWDPRISPALKTIYGYDSSGHLTAISPAGQQPWLLAYGSNSGDATAGRLVSVSRPSASTTLGEGVAPSNTAAPTLSTSSPVVGSALSVSNGTWSNAPLTYAYQWMRCLSGGTGCVTIYGARNSSYTPTASDQGYALEAQVSATNSGGTAVASSSASSVFGASTTVFSSQFGSSGTGNGQFKTPIGDTLDESGNLWVTDNANNRFEEFSPTGAFLHTYASEGGPWGIAIERGTGNIFVTETTSCRVQEFSPAGVSIMTFGTCGSGIGQFSTPTGVTFDPEGNLWVADSSNNRIQVFTATGAYVRTVGKTGSGNGQLKTPRTVTFANGIAYVTDMANNRVEEFSLGGSYLGQFGSAGSGSGQFSSPVGIATDSTSGDLYVSDSGNNRVEEFNPAGTFLTSFGATGSGEGQMQSPYVMVVAPNHTIYLVDKTNNRVELWVPKPSSGYVAQFGSVGTGNGQFKGPAHTAIDMHGNVWVTDTSNNRVEEFSPSGAFMFAITSYGSGSHFSFPTGIAINPRNGKIYVCDEGNGAVVEFGPNGEYKKVIGEAGSTNGKFKFPSGIAIDSSGNLWIADAGNNRVQEINNKAEYLRTIGATEGNVGGTGNGLFKSPAAVTLAGGYVYVLDSGNSRVQWFTTTGTYQGQFGAAGSGNGQFSGPEDIATDPMTGDLYVADTSNFRLQVFSPTGAFVEAIGSSGSGNGQFSKPYGIAFMPAGGFYVADFNNNRVQRFATGFTQAEAPAPPSLGTTAVTTIDYKVPVQGVGAPYAMGSSEVAAWAEEDDPAEATAIFPPDEPQTTPASDYRRATVLYIDQVGHTVNVARPGGSIATTEYDFNNGVIATLSPANRATALAQGSKSVETAEHLEAEIGYGAEDTRILETLGPEHSVKLSSGSEVQARDRTRYFYNEGAPSEGGPYNLVTKVTNGALYSGGEADVRTTVDSYAGQHNLGWRLRKPTSVTTDPSGLKSTRTTLYDPVSGNPIEVRAPGAGPANGPSGEYAYTSQITTVAIGLKKPGGVAVDSSGDVWQVETEANRVEEYSATGESLLSFGSEGTGNGQFKKPQGVAMDASGYVWVTDTGNNRVEEFSSTGAFVQAFGTFGSEPGHLSEPMGIAIDSSGAVWVGDRGNNRLERFSPGGTFEKEFGGVGFENGKFITNFVSEFPMWLAFDPSGHLWVTDGGNNRVQEFSSTGAYMSKFGGEFNKPSSENGKFSTPAGIASDSSGNLWVVDGGNNRVEKFSSAGAYLAKFGESGAGAGQFNAPVGIAVDSKGYLRVADSGNNRLQEWTTAPEYRSSATTVAVALKKPGGVAIDTSGHIWQVESEANRVEEYSATGESLLSFGAEGTGNGQFKKPQGVAIDKSGDVWVTDTGNNRIQEFSSTGTFTRAFGTFGSEPGHLSEPMGIAVDSGGYVWVGDRGNNRLEKFSSEGVFQKEFGGVGFENGKFITNFVNKYPMWLAFDPSGHLWVTDGGNNRVQEFSSAGAYMSKFGGEFEKPSSENGKFSSPAGIASDSSGNIWVVDSGNNRVEEFSSAGGYLGKSGEEGTAGGQFKAPAGIAVTSTGLLWVADTGNNRTEQLGLASADPRVTQMIYYGTAANAAYPECGGHPEWANLVCRTQPVVQPAASVAPKLPVSVVTYNMWDGPESTVETVGTTTRTKKSTFDAAGRALTSSVTSSVGTAVPTVTDEYSSTTGALSKESTTVSEKTQAITTTYNSLGQLTSYTDADGNVATYKYTLDGQTEEASDGKGSQTYTYDAITHNLVKLSDTAAGTFTATYDSGGKMTSESYPNGMTASYVYNAVGDPTSIEYLKTTHCTEKCVWFSETIAPGIDGETLSQTSTLASNAYVYDSLGRLTQVQETPTGGGCKTRLYAYDIESNRTSLTTREPGAEGKCATSGGTAENHSYDEAGRLIDSGVSYDTFGDTTGLPAADAGGHEVTSTYYNSGQLQSQTQNGLTLSYNLDPSGRVRETISSGTKSSDVISHYAGGGSAPAWTSEIGEKWSRNIVGIDGSLAAVQTNGETPILQIHDLEGDVVGTAALSETETKLLTTYNSTEFGVPTTSNPPKYSWGGASGTATEMPSGISNSNTVSYVPQLGRPLQTEGIEPPGASPNGSDTGAPYVSSMEPWVGLSDAAWGAGAVEREAARQGAASLEAMVKVESGPHDPTKYFTTLAEVEEVVRECEYAAGDEAGIMGAIGDFIGEVEEGGAISSIINFFGLNAIQKWFANVADKMKACEAYWNHAPKHERQYCRVKYSEISISVGPLNIKMIDFWATPHVAFCHAFTGPLKKRKGGCVGIAVDWWKYG